MYGNDGCIRYLLNEMDPAEVREFESLIRKDADLLIEVESLRATFKKLDKLPLKEASDKCKDKVLELASEQAQKNKRRSTIIPMVDIFKKAAGFAAVAVFSFAAGYWFTGSDSTSALQNAEGFNSTSIKTVEKPWVDRNEVIHFNDIIQAGATIQISNEYNRSFTKLKPVDENTFLPQRRSDILQTGNSR